MSTPRNRYMKDMIQQLFTRPGMIMTEPSRAYGSHHFATIWEVLQDLMNVGICPMTGVAPAITETFVFGWMFTSLGGEFDADQAFYRSNADASFALKFAQRVNDGGLTDSLGAVVDALPDPSTQIESLRQFILADYTKADSATWKHGPLLAECLRVAAEICPIEELPEDEWTVRMNALREKS